MKLFARSLERDSDYEMVACGESIVIGSDVSGKAVEVRANFREISAKETDAEPDFYGSVLLENEDGVLIGDVIHVGYAQNGGITVRELAEVIPDQQMIERRVVYQEHPRRR